jgi:hypothetical protein
MPKRSKRKPKAAVCGVCGLEMTPLTAPSCSAEARREVVPMIKDGVQYEPVPYNAAKWSGKAGSKCRECAILDGGIHHFGCFQEECPICGGQFISCGCFDECYEHLCDDDDDDDE